jgi:hypothetical protein
VRYTHATCSATAVGGPDFPAVFVLLQVGFSGLIERRALAPCGCGGAFGCIAFIDRVPALGEAQSVERTKPHLTLAAISRPVLLTFVPAAA